MESKRVATLTLDDGRSVELPILEGTLGPDVIDIRALGKMGVFTYDPAFFSTSSCTSNNRCRARGVTAGRLDGLQETEAATANPEDFSFEQIAEIAF